MTETKEVPKIKWTSCLLPKESTTKRDYDIGLFGYTVLDGLFNLAGIDPDSELAQRIREKRAKPYKGNSKSVEEQVSSCRYLGGKR